MRRFLSVVVLAAFAFPAIAQEEIVPLSTIDGGGAAFVRKADGDQYVMQFTDFDLGTLYLDYPVKIPTGSRGVRGVYYVSSIEGNKAILTSVEGNFIPAKTAVMVQGNHNKTYTFTRTNVDVQAITDNLLSGSLVDISVTDALVASGAGDNAIVMTYGKPKNIEGNMGFYRYTGKTLKANKAYLIYDPDKYGNVSSLTIKGIDDDSDAVSEVKTHQIGETWHTLQGIRLNDAPTHPGIYIRNGKAVAVK